MFSIRRLLTNKIKVSLGEDGEWSEFIDVLGGRVLN